MSVSAFIEILESLHRTENICDLDLSPSLLSVTLSCDVNSSQCYAPCLSENAGKLKFINGNKKNIEIYGCCFSFVMV